MTLPPSVRIFTSRHGLAPLEASAATGVGRAPASILSGLVRCGV